MSNLYKTLILGTHKGTKTISHFFRFIENFDTNFVRDFID